jgi:hypothetical protein
MTRDAKEFLVIDRTHEDIQIHSKDFFFDYMFIPFSHADTLPNVVGAIQRSIHGIIGIINLISGPNLIVITSKVRVGDINGQAIYKVQTTDIIPYARNMSHLNEYQVNELFQIIKKRLSILLFLVKI